MAPAEWVAPAAWAAPVRQAAAANRSRPPAPQGRRRRLAPLRLAYNTYGTLNAAKSNAILICHFFSGSSHAAGKYAEADKVPGYSDAIIGPGKAIDTDKYFVVSADKLFEVGWNGGNVDFFSGTIDEVRVYSRALTAAQITERTATVLAGRFATLCTVDEALARAS